MAEPFSKENKRIKAFVEAFMTEGLESNIKL